MKKPNLQRIGMSDLVRAANQKTMFREGEISLLLHKATQFLEKKGLDKSSFTISHLKNKTLCIKTRNNIVSHQVFINSNNLINHLAEAFPHFEVREVRTMLNGQFTIDN